MTELVSHEIQVSVSRGRQSATDDLVQGNPQSTVGDWMSLLIDDTHILIHKLNMVFITYHGLVVTFGVRGVPAFC